MSVLSRVKSGFNVAFKTASMLLSKLEPNQDEIAQEAIDNAIKDLNKDARRNQLPIAVAQKGRDCNNTIRVHIYVKQPDNMYPSIRDIALKIKIDSCKTVIEGIAGILSRYRDEAHNIRSNDSKFDHTLEAKP